MTNLLFAALLTLTGLALPAGAQTEKPRQRPRLGANSSSLELPKSGGGGFNDFNKGLPPKSSGAYGAEKAAPAGSGLAPVTTHPAAEVPSSTGSAKDASSALTGEETPIDKDIPAASVVEKIRSSAPDTKSGGKAAAGSKASSKTPGDYDALMERPPYVGTAKVPCRYGQPLGRCTHEGGPLPPPPSPEGFTVQDVGAIPFFPGTNHHAFPLADRKLALRFKGKPFGPFTVAFDSPNGFVARSAMEMFVAISDKPGDFDVPVECLRTPDFAANGWGGGAAHSVYKIEVALTEGAAPQRVGAEGPCVLKPDGRFYYVNVAGDCSEYYSKGEELANARAAGCVTDLVNVNGWMQALTP